jgi:hypothetical protein
VAVFNRTVIVEVGQEGAPGFALKDLRVSFQVDHKKTGTPNTATIAIYNPNPLSLALLDGPLPVVRLKVGYGDSNAPDLPAIPRLAFTGSPVKNGVAIVKQGADRIVTIDAADGGRPFTQGTVDLTFATPTTFSAVVAAIAGQLALPVGSIVIVPDVLLPQGGVFSGAAKDVLDGIAASTNADWMIRDGVLYFVPRGQPAPGFVPLFSALNGNLIGSPTKKDKGAVEVTALLDASLRPGSSFVLASETISGTFIAGDVSFVGDSGFDTPFYVKTIGHLPGVT